MSSLPPLESLSRMYSQINMIHQKIAKYMGKEFSIEESPLTKETLLPLIHKRLNLLSQDLETITINAELYVKLGKLLPMLQNITEKISTATRSIKKGHNPSHQKEVRKSVKNCQKKISLL